jgi:hypothetical protein
MGNYAQLNTALTLAELASKYTNGDLIADKVCPIFESPRKLIKFWEYDRRDMNRISDARVAPDGTPNQRKFTATTQEARVEPYALFDSIPLSDLDDPEPGIDLEQDTAEDLAHDLQLGHEKRVADLLMTAANYGTANKATVSTAWTNKVSSTPITDIQTGKRACAVPPNIAVCDEVTFDALSSHPDVIAFLRGIGGAVNGLASAAELAAYFGLENVYVGKTKYDSANPGAAASYSYIWPQGRFLLAKVNIAPRQKEVVLCRTLRFKPEGEFGISVSMWDDMKPGTKGVRNIKAAIEEKVVHIATDAGYLISGAA